LERQARREGFARESVERDGTSWQGFSACRDGLFALALAVTRNPEISPRSRDGFVACWLELSRPGARAAWESLAINANFWARLDDGQRARVATLLQRHEFEPRRMRLQVERLLATGPFHHEGAPERGRARAHLMEEIPKLPKALGDLVREPELEPEPARPEP
jgi:hypothetical protein